jgi:very-short-patch-repair endonuclease
VCHGRAVGRRESRKKTQGPAGARRRGSYSTAGVEKDPRQVRILGLRGFFTVSGSLEQRITAIARLQRGRLSRRQLLAAGIGSRAIDRMLSHGLLRREHRGVYAVLDVGPLPLARETAALLACGERAVLSHRSAAALWGLAAQRDGPVSITIACSERGRKRRGITLHRVGELHPRDVRIHQQLPVTSPARTLLDFAAVATTREVERALDEALVVLKLVTKEQLADVIERVRNHPGAPVLKRLLETRGPATITQSEAEELFLGLVRQAGLPAPQCQVQIAGYTVDFYWPEHRVAFEIDGYLFHTSRRSFDRDRSKDAAVKAADVDPNRVSRDQVKHEPLKVATYVAAALTRASMRGRG